MSKNNNRVRDHFWIMAALALLAATLMDNLAAAAQERAVVVNPYAQVDWARVNHYKGNLHTHTTESDGSLAPAAAIDLYHEHGYAVLALTDHDRCTWPWQQFDRNAETLGMTAIPGNELSRHHHVLSLFCAYETEAEDLDAAVAGVAAADGVAVLCHPAMHWEPKHSEASRLRRLLDESARPEEAPPEVVADYVALFRRHPHLVATEILNASEPLYRYPLDRRLWDQLLTAMMPERPVWGVNTDDMHTLDHFGTDYVVFLTARPEAPLLRESLTTGAFYFSSRRVPESGAAAATDPPRIVSITHDKADNVITVRAEVGDAPLPDEAYAWISEGKTVHTGQRLPYRAVNGIGAYARLEITADSGTTFINPFGFSVKAGS